MNGSQAGEGRGWLDENWQFDGGGDKTEETKTFDSPTVVDEMEGGEMLLCSQVWNGWTEREDDLQGGGEEAGSIQIKMNNYQMN